MRPGRVQLSGLVPETTLRLLGIAFMLLVGFEVLVGSLVLFRVSAIDTQLADMVAASATLGMKTMAEQVSFESSFAIGALFCMILFGSVVGGWLFWRLSQFIRLAGLLTDYISDGLAVVDQQGRITSLNRSFADINGKTQRELQGLLLSEVFPQCDGKSEGEDREHCEYRGSRADGSIFVASVSLFRLSHPQAPATNSLVLIRDITDLRKHEDEMRRLAYEDNLTGLANRPALLEKIDRAIVAASRSHTRFALLYIDLDGFKDINDSLGHEAGDQLLKEASRRFRMALRGSDFVARLGGDEFCILLENVHSEEVASRVADRLLVMIGEPVVIEGRRLRPRASIGVAMFPNHGDSREAILQVADTAMYAAKRAGKHRFAYYSPELTRLADLRLSLEHDLRHAIECDEFSLVYQPQVSLNNGQVTGVEALIRWEHPERGLIMPDRFIEVAERIGMINDLGEWVLRNACRQAREWQEQGVYLNMAVNISGSHFQSAGLYDACQRILHDTGMSPQLLELEVTEGVMQTAAESVANFHRLKTLGLNIAIDDFGTGYSSLSSLKKMPVNHLKVDREFLQDVLKDNKQAVIIATIIGMARALSLKVIVEGVETREQLQFLQGLGCDLVQGYFFSKPVAAAEIPALYRRGFKPGVMDNFQQTGTS